MRLNFDMSFAEVIVDISNSEVDRIFDYAVGSSDLKPGMRVIVPFGPRQIEGYVISLKEETAFDISKIKPIISVLDNIPVISDEMLELAKFMVKKYHLRVADVLRLFIPSGMRQGKIKELKRIFVSVNGEYLDKDVKGFIKPSALQQNELFNYLKLNGETAQSEINKNFSASALRNLIARGVVSANEKEVLRKPYGGLDAFTDTDLVLTDEQNDAVEQIKTIKSGTALLYGVTGSGKTEVYMRLIADALKVGKTAVMLVPEIALTPQVLRNFRARFGENVALLHSGLSQGERFDEWRRLLFGEASVVIGPRSAVFAPLKNLGIIIIDEEHDSSSYTSESNPRYYTHDVAEFRRSYNDCTLILGSATPSVESYYAALSGKYRLIEMTERVNKKPLPEIEVVDMRKELYAGNNGIFSRSLEAALRDCIEKGNQAMLFINRRGYSSYVICRSCGFVAKCTDCDVSLVYHKDDNALKCHYCGLRYAPLDLCPECKTPLGRGYTGTERVVETLRMMFPDKTILRMDNDTTQTKDAHAKILAEFGSKKASILVGTQMIAKGHDFPGVTLVGILDADMSLYFSDYRSIERTFQLITQVSGRAGRENKAGKVILQTYTPHHYVYKYAVKNDYKAFYEKESNLRETAKFPPFSKIVRILLTGESQEDTEEVLKLVFDDIRSLAGEYKSGFAYLAAMRSPVKKIKNQYRVQILMRLSCNEDEILQKIFDITDKYRSPKITCFIEQNPNSLS